MSNCPECGMPIKTVPAGISKSSGKPYSEFQCCSNRNCSYKPPRDFKKPLKSVPPGISQGTKDLASDTQSVLMGAKLDIIISLLRDILKAVSSKPTVKEIVKENWGGDLDSDLNEQ